jgi:hypothetical protein
MRLRRHLAQVSDMLVARAEIVVEAFIAEETVPNLEGNLQGRLRFWDNSLLVFSEVLVTQGVILQKVEYSYHYQTADGTLIFRYDNSPHHRQIATFPHHKHTTEGIVDSRPLHLIDVLREIDTILYQPTA